MLTHSVGKHEGALWCCIHFSHNENNTVQSLKNLFHINVISITGTVLQITLLQRDNFLFSLKREQKAAYRTNK